MNYILEIIVDFIFPPREEELKLRKIEPKNFLNIVGKSRGSEFPFIKPVLDYKDPLVKELVWQIKYKKNKHALKCASCVLYNELKSLDLKNTLLIPIPISKSRRKERGYNQCELIINEMSRLDPNIKSNFNLLVRIKDIEKQTFKNRSERIENTSNIFEVREKILDKEIIIIDDVTTTGSTLKEARETLIQAGYKKISALTLAH
jgi:competence protein ComFC